jgi:hypothetical protein
MANSASFTATVAQSESACVRTSVYHRRLATIVIIIAQSSASASNTSGCRCPLDQSLDASPNLDILGFACAGAWFKLNTEFSLVVYFASSSSPRVVIDVDASRRNVMALSLRDIIGSAVA